MTLPKAKIGTVPDLYLHGFPARHFINRQKSARCEKIDKTCTGAQRAFRAEQGGARHALRAGGNKNTAVIPFMRERIPLGIIISQQLTIFICVHRRVSPLLPSRRPDYFFLRIHCTTASTTKKRQNRKIASMNTISPALLPVPSGVPSNAST